MTRAASYALWVRRRNLMIGLVAIMVLGVRHVGDWLPLGQHFPYVLEALALGVIAWALWAHPDVRQALVGGPRELRSLRWVSATLLALFALGHLLKQNDATFPFVGWTMYGNIKDTDAPCQLYEAELRSGRRVDFNPAQVLPTLADARVEHLLKYQIEAIRHNDEPARRAQRMDAHSRTLQALARVHDRRWPGDPVARISVSWCSVPVDGFAGVESIREEPLWQIEVPAHD